MHIMLTVAFHNFVNMPKIGLIPLRTDAVNNHKHYIYGNMLENTFVLSVTKDMLLSQTSKTLLSPTS